MSYFDTDGDGHINFDEFLVGVRVSFNIFNLLMNSNDHLAGKNERQETSYD